MLLEIGLIAGGIPAGWAIRHCACIVRWVNECLSWTVRIMLFLLGLALGLDDSLIGQLESLGLYALVISSFSVAGCFLAAHVLGRYVFTEYAPGTQKGAGGPAAGSRGSFIALAFFVAGAVLGWLRIVPQDAAAGEAAVWEIGRAHV